MYQCGGTKLGNHQQLLGKGATAIEKYDEVNKQWMVTSARLEYRYAGTSMVAT